MFSNIITVSIDCPARKLQANGWAGLPVTVYLCVNVYYVLDHESMIIHYYCTLKFHIYVIIKPYN